MGGGFDRSSTPVGAAEFNAWSDPEALSLVLDSPIPVTLVPLDVTEHATLEVEDLADLPSGRVAVTLREAVEYYAQVHVSQLGTRSTRPHDALAAVALAVPEIVTTVSGRISVDCSRSPGITTFAPCREGRHHVVRSHSQERFLRELQRGLAATAGRPSPWSTEKSVKFS